MSALPLCVDLDGTLLKTDSLLELLVRVLKHQPWLVFCLPFWFLKGKPVLKRELAVRCDLDWRILPYNKVFLDFLQAEHAAGRKLYLATGAHERIAESVARYLGIFTDVFATGDKENLTGKNKAALLVQRFGEKGFAYAGNDNVDCAVWKSAAECYLVNATPAVAQSVRKQIAFAGEMDLRTTITWRLCAKAMRLHQWAKNGLIFVPLLASHQVMDMTKLADVLLAFLAFGFCASFSYIINDIGDLDADRKHHSKHKRPFASGELSVPFGLMLALFLICLAMLLSILLPLSFAYCLLAYFVVTNLYTLRLKYIPILDVAILAGLYTLRVIAGGLAAQVPASFWLLVFSCFIFFSLAIVKRMSELLGIEAADEKAVIFRGYWTSDMPVLVGLGTSSALMAVLVLALYINSPDVVTLYASPRYLWLLCPVVALWMGRVWLITGRGQMNEDPVVFALRDRVSWLLFGLAGLFLVIGTQF